MLLVETGLFSSISHSSPPFWDSVAAAFARLIQLVSAMPVSLGCAMQMLHTDGANELHATTPSHLGLTTLSPGSARIPLNWISSFMEANANICSTVSQWHYSCAWSSPCVSVNWILTSIEKNSPLNHIVNAGADYWNNPRTHSWPDLPVWPCW